VLSARRHINRYDIETKVFATVPGARQLSSELLAWYYPPCCHVNGESIETKVFAAKTQQVHKLRNLQMRCR